MNLVARGYRLKDRAVRTAAGLTVQYIRGNDVISDALPAALDASDIEQVVEGNTTVVGRQFNWQLHREEFLLNNEPIRPKRRDLIRWFYEGSEYSFEVLTDAAQAALPNDMRNTYITVSTKLVPRNE